MVDFQQVGELFDVLRGSFGLAVEDGGGGDFVPADVRGDLFEAELFGRFGAEESGG